MNNWKIKENEYQAKIREIDIIKKTGKKARTELSEQGKLGAFYTPEETIVYLTNNAFDELLKEDRLLKLANNNPMNLKILEPSVGLGAFLPVIVEKLLPLYRKYFHNEYGNFDDTKWEFSKRQVLEKELFYLRSIFENNIYMCDIDENVIPMLKERLYDLLTYKDPDDGLEHRQDFFDFNDFNIYVGNFLENDFNGLKFDIILGNPPYGVDVNSKIEKDLSKRTLSGIDKKFDKRYGLKIKKESYSYFIVHSIELLKEHGILSFITSDTFLTLGTFLGLRNFMLEEGKVLDVSLSPKNLFQPFTTYPTASFTFIKGGKTENIKLQLINKKENYLYKERISSYTVPIDYINIFNNKPFYYHSYKWKKDFRNKKLLSSILKTVGGLTTGKNELFIEDYNEDKHKKLIGKSYAYYNKSLPGVKWFSEPKYVIKWTNNGEEVRKYKAECGKWYLKGMGGQDYYFKEGIQINLIGSKINARYTPKDMYVFDAGSPMIVMNKDNDKDEIYFILAYLNSEKASILLKEVINHTRNIQPKNIGELPYPELSKEDKEKVIKLAKENIISFTDTDVVKKNEILINEIFNRIS